MKTSVAFFFGGVSVEHEVSIIHAVQAMHSIDADKYGVVPVYIAKTGEFLHGPSLLEMDAYRDMAALRKNCREVTFIREGGRVQMMEKKHSLLKSKPVAQVDVAFPVTHGTNGEDGTMQAYFELLGLPYVGCDILASAVGMDKAVSKDVLAAAGIPVLPYKCFTARAWSRDRDALIETVEVFGYPLMVKPANTGSSVGISKAGDREALLQAVPLAASFSAKILVEPAVTALREINCSVLGDADNCRASVCEEPVMSDEILSYADKYESKSSSKGMSSSKRKLPAELPEAVSAEIQRLAVAAFRAVGCAGVTRVDFLMDTNSEEIYVNELNTIPGALSYYLWEATGFPYENLLDELIDLAMKRYRTRKNIMFTYETNILADAGSFGAKGVKS